MESIQKFQNLLKELFQFEASELDFGIYRILNYKREQIEKFIQEDLKNRVEFAFAKHKDERLTGIDQKFEEAKQELLDAASKLGKEPLTPLGELKDEFKDSLLGRKYLTLKAQRDEAQAIDEIKLQVFNDLYNFFRRYYEEGDFVPQYRHSIKEYKYAVPYNGEEIKLYWANNEQYYTKTGLLFRDYTFKASDCKVIFRIVKAKEELGLKKATKERFFLLDDENPINANEREAIIRFQYRELTDEEVKNYQLEGGSNASKQERINQKSYEEVLKRIKDIELKTYLEREYKNEKPLLLYQISRFTAKNKKDYFIHENLKKFLSEQLDYFVKSEVLDIETLEKERFLDKHITRAKVVREIGEDIIDFLSQIEDFQKRLWEKKKFVLKTEYVITTDRIFFLCHSERSEESLEYFYDEIWKNKEQKREWKDSGFEIPKAKEELKNKKLPIDTEYFSQEFKERLLERLTEIPSPIEGEGKGANLDGLLDGLLIKSENWQALNLLLGKYKGEVQTIYIDPPFNKEEDADYLYNVKYKDSTWVSLLENRLWLAKDLLSDRGSIFVRCDYNGNWLVRPLMNEIFGEGNFRNEIVVNRTKKIFTGVQGYNIASDSLFFFTKIEGFKFSPYYKQRAKEQKWLNMHSPGERRPPERIILGNLYYPPKGRHWTFIQEKIRELEEQERVKIDETIIYIDMLGNKVKGMPQYLTGELELLDSNWTDIPGYSQTYDFPTENSEILLKRVIESTSNESNLVMDFFLGSGTTTAVAHKLKRKWIGVEMGEYFWTIVLPRMKKVLAYDKSGISKEKDVKEKYNEKTAGGFFKYQVLEQYEDTLDNIELKENQKALEFLKDDYLLRYFLNYETRENPYLLNIDRLKKPFSYKLKVNPEEVGEPEEIVADIPETFNYLLGLKVKKIKARYSPSPSKGWGEGDKRKYLFILGEKEGKGVAILWREYGDNWSEDDFKEDKEFIIKELEPWAPHIVYVNGQSVLTPKLGKNVVEVRYIEPEFKKLMEA